MNDKKVDKRIEKYGIRAFLFVLFLVLGICQIGLSNFFTGISFLVFSYIFRRAMKKYEEVVNEKSIESKND